MSKELIDRLKSYIPSGDGHHSQYANDLADAVAILEAKAAPVGEREAFEAWFKGESKIPDPCRLFGKDWEWYAFQAGAAHQRQQAREVVMPPLMPSEPFTTIDRGSKNFKAGWNACVQEFARLNKGAGHE